MDRDTPKWEPGPEDMAVLPHCYALCYSLFKKTIHSYGKSFFRGVHKEGLQCTCSSLAWVFFLLSLELLGFLFPGLVSFRLNQTSWEVNALHACLASYIPCSCSLLVSFGVLAPSFLVISHPLLKLSCMDEVI